MLKAEIDKLSGVVEAQGKIRAIIVTQTCTDARELWAFGLPSRRKRQQHGIPECYKIETIAFRLRNIERVKRTGGRRAYLIGDPLAVIAVGLVFLLAADRVASTEIKLLTGEQIAASDLACEFGL